MPESKKTEAKVSVTIWGNHSHQGKPVKPGSKIEVSAEKAEWLKSAGVLDKPAEGEG